MTLREECSIINSINYKSVNKRIESLSQILFSVQIAFFKILWISRSMLVNLKIIYFSSFLGSVHVQLLSI